MVSRDLTTHEHKVHKAEWRLIHDDVIKWKHIRRYWHFVRGNHGYRWFPLTKANDAEL